MHRNDAQILRILARAKLEGDGWMFVLDIHKQTRGRLFRHIGFGSIYVSLARLESSGLVESEWKQVRPADHPHPRRRAYRITEQGDGERAKLPAPSLLSWLVPDQLGGRRLT